MGISRKQFLQRFAIFWLLTVLLSGCLPVCAARAEVAFQSLTYNSPATGEYHTWDFPYDDAFFDQADSVYNHTLAQSSLGLALAAYRSPNVNDENQDADVKAYLTQAGFTSLQSDDYDALPIADTISTLIGQKEMNGYTVVAVAVCGANYTDEWLSNFDIGDETRHRGFNKAAQQVEARIQGYLADQGITGTVKLWITGYSRAAAVTNLTAADMTDSGLFAGVYAYTFATPRTTREPGSYANIFNIVGKFDPVPSVPLAEWGYYRCGTDLYTPAQETDSDYRQKKAAANVISEQLTGMPFWNSVDRNNTLHTILDYIYELLPTATIYEAKMHTILDAVWQDRSLPNLASVFLKMMEDKELINETNRNEMEYLLDYLSMTTYTTVTGQAGWNKKTTMLENLAHEHSPDVYVAWMFSSDNPLEIFTDKLDYVRLTYRGHVRISLCGEKGFYLTVNDDGTTSDWSDNETLMGGALPVAQRPMIAVDFKGTQTILTIPKDNVYTLLLEPLATEPLTYFATAYQVGRMRGDLGEVSITNMEEGQLYSAISYNHTMDSSVEDSKTVYGDDDFSFSLWSEELPYSTTVLSGLETQNVFHLTFTQLAWLAGGLALLVVLLILFITLALVKRHHRHKKSKEKTNNATNT